MNIRKIGLRILIVLIIVSGGAIYIVVNHSTTQTALTCAGKWTTGVAGWQGQDEIVYAILHEYRPWIV